MRALLAILPFVATAAPPSDKAPPWERPRETARLLFLDNCSVCHDTAKAKSAKIGPSLMRFKKVPPERIAPFRQYIVTKVQAGGIKMPAFGKTLTDAQMKMIAGYLLPER